jgi:hypothetical protein
MELALLEPIEAIPIKIVNIFDEIEYIEGPDCDEAQESFIMMISLNGKIKNLYIQKSAGINIIGSVYCKIYMKDDDDEYHAITESFECHGSMKSDDIKIISPNIQIKCSSKNEIFTIKIKDLYFEVFNNTDTTVILQPLNIDMIPLGEYQIEQEDYSLIKIDTLHKFYKIAVNISGQNTYITEPFTFLRNSTDKIKIICSFFKYKISIKNDIIQLRIDHQDL